MPHADREVDVAKRLKVIEWLKTEIVDHTAGLLKSILEGNHPRIVDRLASLILSCYVIGRRFGISYWQLDDAIVDKLRRHRTDGHQLEDWYRDISTLEDHLRKR